MSNNLFGRIPLSIQALMAIKPRNPNLWEFNFIDALHHIFYIKTISLPFIKLETETRSTGTKHYTKFVSEEEFKITFHETQDFQILHYLETWMDTVFSPFLKVFNIGVHVKQASLRFMDYLPGASILPIPVPVRMYTFNDILIKGIDNKELDYEKTEGDTISANFIAKSVWRTGI